MQLWYISRNARNAEANQNHLKSHEHHQTSQKYIPCSMRLLALLVYIPTSYFALNNHIVLNTLV